jgi:membrane protease YdiL (CAAX protease family)
MSDSGLPGTPGPGSEWFPPWPNAPFPPAPSEALPAVPVSPGGRPRSTWRWWEALIVFFLGLVAAGLLGAAVFVLFGKGHAAEVAVNVIGEVVPGGFLLLWLRAYHPGWQRAIGFPTRSQLLREIRAGVLTGIALYLGIAFGVAAILTAVFEQASGKSAKTPQQLPSVSGIGVLFAVLLAVVAAPLVEELFFRGCVFRSLRDRRGFPLAAIVSALLFGLVHYVPGPWQDTLLLMTIMVFTGFGLAWFYDRRGNLVASIAAHATFNTIGLILIFSFR